VKEHRSKPPARKAERYPGLGSVLLGIRRDSPDRLIEPLLLFEHPPYVANSAHSNRWSET
jgi:hypothetical protein